MRLCGIPANVKDIATATAFCIDASVAMIEGSTPFNSSSTSKLNCVKVASPPATVSKHCCSVALLFEYNMCEYLWSQPNTKDENESQNTSGHDNKHSGWHV
jgi:hypothetical protein